MEKNGSQPIQLIHETSDICVYITSQQSISLFVKEAKTDAGKISNQREFHNQVFLNKITEGKEVGFTFLEPTIEDNKIIFPNINDKIKWLATEPASGSYIAPLYEYSRQMLDFMKFCLGIPYSDIPQEIKNDSEKRKNNLIPNFEKDSEYLQMAGILQQSDKQKMKQYLEKWKDANAFQHHDIVPWHMARQIQDGRLVLVDSGWSGWSLKYYDIAYFVLQMIGYAERKEDAADFFEMAKQEFESDPKFQETLATVFSYRGVRLAAELHRQGKTRNAQEVLSTAFTKI